VANNSNPLRLLWPEIHDMYSAKSASRLGVFASVLMGLIVAGPITYGLFRGIEARTDDMVVAYSVASVYVFLALGIWRMWRTPAIIALALYLVELVALALKQGALNGYIVTVAMGLFFVSGVRGTIGYKRLSGLPVPVDLRDA
jgi:hypothetical protein